jgi:hypothetical protein
MRCAALMSRPLAWRLSGISAFMPFHPTLPTFAVLAHSNSAIYAFGDRVGFEEWRGEPHPP